MSDLRVVYKYVIPLQEISIDNLWHIPMPPDALIRAVHWQGRANACIWAEVSQAVASSVKRTFAVFPTGYSFQGDFEYLGTVFNQDASLVFHIYEVI